MTGHLIRGGSDTKPGVYGAAPAGSHFGFRRAIGAALTTTIS